MRLHQSCIRVVFWGASKQPTKTLIWIGIIRRPKPEVQGSSAGDLCNQRCNDKQDPGVTETLETLQF